MSNIPSKEGLDMAIRAMEFEFHRTLLPSIALAIDAAVQAERARVDGILQFYLKGHTDPESDYSKHDLVSDLILEMKP